MPFNSNDGRDEGRGGIPGRTLSHRTKTNPAQVFGERRHVCEWAEDVVMPPATGAFLRRARWSARNQTVPFRVIEIAGPRRELAQTAVTGIKAGAVVLVERGGRIFAVVRMSWAYDRKRAACALRRWGALVHATRKKGA